MRSHHTLRSFFLIVACIVTTLASAQRVAADTLYGATGSRGVAGHLLILDQTTGAVVTDVGALQDADGNNYGLTGLAFQPGIGILFGSTANNSPTARSHLVIINPNTAQVTDIGSFGFDDSTMSDITFDPITKLFYGWRSAGDDHGIYTIDIATGAATLVGGITPLSGGGGLAASSEGTLFNTPDGFDGIPSGHLTILDNLTGLPTTVGVLFGGPTPPVINAMDFDGAGVLFGVQTNGVRTSLGNPALTHLVTIDTTTAFMTELGASANNLDAIAFLRPTAPEQVPEPTSMLLLGLGLAGTFLWVKRPQLSKILVLTTRKRQRR
jgi:hypothetical protein